MNYSSFEPGKTSDIAKLIEQYPLAWVVSSGPGGFAATPLPLLAELDGAGEVKSLFGHFAKANPHVASLEQQTSAIILVQGPQGYVAPRLVSNPTWGPTWNYAVARFDVDVRFVPDETSASIDRLAASLERGEHEPWTTDRMGNRREELVRHIIAFRATVKAAHLRFKLGQDETPETFDEIVSGLADQRLADWMVRTTRG